MGGQLVHERAPPGPRCALASHPAHGGGFLPELGRIWPRPDRRRLRSPLYVDLASKLLR
jgi:hypothetical protein